ncbi:MAG: Hsp70 family protein [Oscillospiraceae bacterium]|nr:Hsp70 family protein [Oscillospiraceae bacterium]
MGVYIGIDLGTTYSVVAYDDGSGNPRIIQTTQDSVTTPSAVYISSEGELQIGEDAKYEQKHKSAVATFYKRNIGSDSADYYLEDGNEYSAADLSSIFLKELMARAEKTMGQKIDGAVITVPAYFSEHEKSNTRKAAQKAGINVLHMINEPTAAAVAYGLDKGENKTILVYDLGGGTFDVSVAHITKQVIKIIATTGDFELGGKDWDTVLCNWAAEQFAAQFGEDFSCDPEMMDSLMVDVEKMKRRLTQSPEAPIQIKYGSNIGKFQLTEAEFRSRSRELLERTGALIEKLFRESNLSWADIDDVILVGGSTRMKMVEDYIVELRGKPALRGINADEAVARGAAIVAASFNSFNLGTESTLPEIEDVNSHSLGLISFRPQMIGGEQYRVFYNEIMIPKNSPLKGTEVTKRLKPTGDTQDIYLTQWESDSLPEAKAIIGKYQVSGIRRDSIFSVTYGHNLDGTVSITAEQDGRQIPVTKLMNHADRSFDAELMRKPARGAIMIAVDLSGSMSNLTDERAYKEMGKRIKSGCATPQEYEQYGYYEKYNQCWDTYSNTKMNSAYDSMERFASAMWYTAIGEVKTHLLQFISQFPLSNVSFGIMGFADRNHVYCPITNDGTVIQNAVVNMVIGEETGECNEAQPMDDMFNMLSQIKAAQGLDFAYAVVLTDGQWDKRACMAALNAKQNYIRNGIEIIAQGFGKANERFIRELATKTELSGVGDLSSLGDQMSNIAQVISDGFSLTAN